MTKTDRLIDTRGRTLWERLAEYYDEDEATEWLTSPHPQLEHHLPCILMAQGREAEVHAVLDRLESGGYL